MHPLPCLGGGKRAEVRQLFITRLLHFSSRGSPGMCARSLGFAGGIEAPAAMSAAPSWLKSSTATIPPKQKVIDGLLERPILITQENL